MRVVCFYQMTRKGSRRPQSTHVAWIQRRRRPRPVDTLHPLSCASCLFFPSSPLLSLHEFTPSPSHSNHGLSSGHCLSLTTTHCLQISSPRPAKRPAAPVPEDVWNGHGRKPGGNDPSTPPFRPRPVPLPRASSPKRLPGNAPGERAECPKNAPSILSICIAACRMSSRWAASTSPVFSPAHESPPLGPSCPPCREYRSR